MNDQELSLQFAVQRYIYDFLENGGELETELVTGWENMNLATYLTNRLITHGWIKDE